MLSPTTVSDEILCGNRVLLRAMGEEQGNSTITGQVVELKDGTASVSVDDSGQVISVPVKDLKNLPRRFAGTLMKYSTKGILKNWKVRYFEVWSNTLTYREENTPTYKGELTITPQTEIVSFEFRTPREQPPLKYAFGILNDGKVFRVCSDDAEQIEELKRALQDAINDSVMYVPL
mmetsp:Transcript_12395/g.18791  ORF Transcript_12395/g.18791 Transcript_12395/m.18791 type:complete len:176 (+) Transcript_12395:134-661(+)|eukprot:CAMPEP_0185020268 /NCGR_PEP_ID=MMETSP1103-20130426/2870_1 /TAXON_ID=36769 /ORGANISM="Paraphysomonas bandaiensis, Strain Caron Lab Isolate" /LENGTH=175 /DNA_ID=CAMNT_0027551059 /DNA_START=89 /DNA_END=616 /DNA_ORIENTATION=-